MHIKQSGFMYSEHVVHLQKTKNVCKKFFKKARFKVYLSK